jgi:hypothetical protein
VRIGSAAEVCNHLSWASPRQGRRRQGSIRIYTLSCRKKHDFVGIDGQYRKS